jgi:hypothetical protein
MIAFGLKAGVAALALVALAGCATSPSTGQTAGAAPAATATGPQATAEAFAKDRQAILAMQGTYRVTFDFKETVAIAKDYKLVPSKLSRAEEVVFVIADTDDFISLQHILVVGPDNEPMVVKHWRQDWKYEPAKVLDFEGHDKFRMEDVAADNQTGAWSQVVYQVDDSPRYGGVGVWKHEADASTWQSNVSWRPLPRRDDTTRADYDAIAAVNRHTITSFGWTHEQDNSKLKLTETGPREIVREFGINTYTKSGDVNRKVVDDYWAKTEVFWADVRKAWTALEADGREFTVVDDAEGTQLYMPVLTIADALIEGKVEEKKAAADAVALIRKQTTGPAAVALASRE